MSSITGRRPTAVARGSGHPLSIACCQCRPVTSIVLEELKP
jgi:hypothetical protein